MSGGFARAQRRHHVGERHGLELAREEVANLEHAETWFTVQSELHAHIQDGFNEQGVQIMSPHFMVQPDKAVGVPKFQWYAPPAQAEPPTRTDGA